MPENSCLSSHQKLNAWLVACSMMSHISLTSVVTVGTETVPVTAAVTFPAAETAGTVTAAEIAAAAAAAPTDWKY